MSHTQDTPTFGGMRRFDLVAACLVVIVLFGTSYWSTPAPALDLRCTDADIDRKLMEISRLEKVRDAVTADANKNFGTYSAINKWAKAANLADSIDIIHDKIRVCFTIRETN